MATIGFFTYLRLKVGVILLRTLAGIGLIFTFRRDRLLVQKIPIEHQRIRIPTRDKGRYLTADIYYPPGQSASTSSKTPVLVNWHGSGFVMPLLGSDTVFCARVAHDAGITVLDSDYRKAPENPFPAALHDVEDVLKWVATQSDRFDASRVAVSGFSAGANLALVAASALRKTLTGLVIRVVVAIYPVTDISIAPEAKVAPKPRRPLPKFLSHLFDDSYVPDKVTRTDPRVSPSRADPADFPSTVAIVTCDGDTLAPEANALADKLRDGQRTVVSRMLKDVPHGFDNGAKQGTIAWDRREEAYALAVKTLKEALNL
jgi:acetyl esterase/lipase